MKKSMAVLMGFMMVTGVGRTYAQSNFVQNLNFTLTATVQVADNTTKKVAISSKQIIAALSGISSTNTVTNIVTDTFGPLSVTNDNFLPTNPFPATVVLSNYVISIGIVSYTNNVTPGFTNNIIFTQTSTNPITYAFDNLIIVSNYPPDPFGNLTGQVIQGMGRFATAVLTATNPVTYTVTGVVTNSTTTNVVTTTPTFSNTAKLLNVNSIGDTNDTPPRFVVRDGKKPNVVNTDVTSFFTLETLDHVTQAKPDGKSSVESSRFSLGFNNTKGTSFESEGVSVENVGEVKSKGTVLGTFTKSLSAAVVGSGTIAISGGSGRMVLTGKVSITGGTVE